MASRALIFSIRVAVVGVGLTCMSANQHLQTSANQQNRDLEIHLDGETITCNLDSPGAQIVKYRDGGIKQLEFNVVTTRVLVTFYPDKRHGQEIVDTFRRYNMFEDRMLPDGEWQSFTPNGSLLTRQNWQTGKLHGRQETYNRFGNLINESHYDEGYPVGVWKRYYTEGAIAAAITFPDSASRWRDTIAVGGIHTRHEDRKRRIALMPFQTHLYAQEIWYSQSGAKLKEIEYRLQAQRRGPFTMIPTGSRAKFHRNGATAAATNLHNGTGSRVEHLRDSRGPYQRVTHWTGGRVTSNHLSRPGSP
ncbi:hypothetical protein SCG7086_CA_00020 [Chlamydiales bacterium SCGC AG-110-P3]|nr:hypothetical protein SCG7086_CA_00020 [Chlamydiales bacterium SCGC AG-110-P3]